MVQKCADALLIGTNAFFSNRRVQLATLAARHALPAIYFMREFGEAGGLMSYGANIADMYRHGETYSVRPRQPHLVTNAKQYVVIAAGGHGKLSTGPTDVVGRRLP